MPAPELRVVASAELASLGSIPGAPPETGAIPVLCFLHGTTRVPRWTFAVRSPDTGPLRPASAPLALTRLIVVAPQLPTRGDLWSRYSGPVHEIVLYVQATEQGDPDRSYLTGFSFGGNGVCDLSLAEGDFWAALWSVDPTPPPLDDPGLPSGSPRARCRVFANGPSSMPAVCSGPEEGCQVIGSWATKGWITSARPRRRAGTSAYVTGCCGTPGGVLGHRHPFAGAPACLLPWARPWNRGRVASRLRRRTRTCRLRGAWRDGRRGDCARLLARKWRGRRPRTTRGGMA
jgi:hypothetical protein